MLKIRPPFPPRGKMTIKIGLEVSNLHFMWGSLPAPIGLICGSCLTYFDPGEDRVAVG